MNSNTPRKILPNFWWILLKNNTIKVINDPLQMKENFVKYEPVYNVICQWNCTKVILTSEFKLLTYCIVFRHCNRCEFRWKNNSLGTLKACETWLTHILISVGENYFLTEFSFRNYSLYYCIVVLENIIGVHLGICSSSRDC